jgi:hypothetical protein
MLSQRNWQYYAMLRLERRLGAFQNFLGALQKTLMAGLSRQHIAKNPLANCAACTALCTGIRINTPARSNAPPRRPIWPTGLGTPTGHR